MTFDCGICGQEFTPMHYTECPALNSQNTSPERVVDGILLTAMNMTEAAEDNE